MKLKLFKYFFWINYLLKSLFTTRKKIILLSIPTHPNLGDLAQLMCTEKWIKKNYPDYKLFCFPHLCIPVNNDILSYFLNTTLFSYIALKLTVKKQDIFIGHSGYFFVDHHPGWFSYEFIEKHFKNRFLILPQTINFYAPAIKERVSQSFGNKKNLTILCRDNISYENAKNLFGGTKLLLFPDIVTSLIGTHDYCNKREGILFCMRDDLETFYSTNEIEVLMTRFGNIRKEKVDTTLKTETEEIQKKRDQLIFDMIDKISTYKVVITDRYHGTIFSAIANTPVIVIRSTDHKLSSGVNWFSPSVFGNNIQFANDLDDAYYKACAILESQEIQKNPSYFKEQYWEKLSSLY